MKICSNCGASNGDAARYCAECGKAMSGDAPAPPASPAAAPAPPAVPEAERLSLAASMAARAGALQGKRRADVIFVLDCTGSMQ
ncbi:MAG TPA: zinc-ribbon domain-containing protein, partial [Armatimonadota bacterium]|nr:zinc-ribbon domain-containing protein [Armatimonadota bacterium]